MTVARHYVMTAKAGEGERLVSVLRDIATLVRPVPGCLGVEVLRDTGNALRFILIERWTTVEAHRAAGPHLQRDLLPQLTAVLDGQPDAACCDILASS